MSVSDRDIDAAIEAFVVADPTDGLPPVNPAHGSATTWRWIEPLSVAADQLVDALYNDDDRIETGILDLDLYLRGWRPKELCLICSFPHAGKSQTAMQICLNNPDKRVLYLSIDDPAPMILQKLVAMSLDLDGKEFESEIRAGNPECVEVLHNTPAERFPNLVVIDKAIGVDDLPNIIDEATRWWNGLQPQLVIIDYLGLLGAANGGHVEDGFASVSIKMKQLKAFAKSLPCPLLVVHQGTRTGARPGSPITLTSMAFGGEQEATQVIGIRRKRDDTERTPAERHRWRNVITFDIPKNKRIAGRLSGPDGIDLFMDPRNGSIRALRDSDFE